MPFFNRQNNDDLILAIQAAGVSRGRNGFRKDKGGEKLAESEEDLLEISCQREQSWACSNNAECSRYYATPHRWHRRFRYSLHRLREISISRRFLYQCFGCNLIYFYTYWAMRWNDFALANAVLRAVPDGHSRKSFHRRAIVNGASVSAIRHLSLSHGHKKNCHNLRLNRIAVLNICSTLILSLQMDFAKECLKTYDALIHYLRKNS